VLSFSIIWEDRSYDGGDKTYTLNFFLSDNSVEVKEINEANNGKTPFPMLLKRQKLAKTPILTHCPGMSLKKEEFYGPTDLLIGNKVSIFGRECLIYDCDDFTRQYYKAVFDQEMNPIQIRKAKANLVY
jgi:hypothetical protein